MIPMQTVILMVLLSIIPGLGCYREDQQQQLNRCEAICAEPAGLCNEFIYEDCMAGCMDKFDPGFVDVFELCVDCYTRVQCDVDSFSMRCSGPCMF